MHTIDGAPAFFDGKQIVTGSVSRIISLVEDLPTIRTHRGQSVRYRKSRGWETRARYGHFKVSIE